MKRFLVHEYMEQMSPNDILNNKSEVLRVLENLLCPDAKDNRTRTDENYTSPAKAKADSGTVSKHV